MSIPKNRPPQLARQGSHYFDPAPSVESKPRKVHLHVGELAFELQADRGVFGSRGVDLGTLVLLREAPPPPAQGDILDLGSGYGPRPSVRSRQPPGARIWASAIHRAPVRRASVWTRSTRTRPSGWARPRGATSGSRG